MGTRQGVAALTCLGLLVGLVAAAAQQPSSSDVARAAWRYRRTVSLPEAAVERFVAVPVDPEVAASSQLGLGDLRLVDETGAEVPYVLQRQEAVRAEWRVSGELADAQRQRRVRSSWTADFGSVVTFDRLQLAIDGVEFTKRVRVDASDDGATWTEVVREVWLFDREWRGRRVHHTAIVLAAPATARYVRVETDDVRSRPVAVTRLVATLTRSLEGLRWSRDAGVELVETDGDRTRYRVQVPDGFPVTQVELDADDAAFWRRVSIIERRRVSGELREVVSGAGEVYRLRLDDEALDADQRAVGVRRTLGGELLVEVVNDDGPPLSNMRARLSGPETRLLVSTARPRLTLYYGNAVTRAPVYDLHYLEARLSLHADYPAASVGEATENPEFASPPPLAFLPERGAAVDAARWRAMRELRVTGGEDLYTVLLTPMDVAALRADGGDLRLVDSQDRQIPYVIEPRAARQRVTLSIERLDVDRDGASVSRYRLRVPEMSERVPLQGLELSVAERFFDRRATLFIGAPADRQRRMVLRDIALVSRSRDDEPLAPVLVDLPGTEARELELVIDEGDNAPLTITSAAAFVEVPRITFKAGPGAYHLLLGNPDSSSPRYDVASLRREVLSYSALPIELDEQSVPTGNPQFRRQLRDFARDAPPTALLWTTLGVAVLVLLYLTRRALAGPRA